MMRHVTVLAFLVWGVAWGQTFQVKSGVWPWHDRVNQWQLVDVPDQLVSDDAIPQQSCGSRGLVFPKGLKAAVVAMNSSDANRLVSKLKIPLRETDLKVTIQSPDGKKRLPYPVFVYPNPPEKLDSKGNARAGLLLLKLSDDGIKSRPRQRRSSCRRRRRWPSGRRSTFIFWSGSPTWRAGARSRRSISPSTHAC
jgi:hypothetical protein